MLPLQNHYPSVPFFVNHVPSNIGYRKEIYFDNTTGCDVWILDRENSPILVPRSRTGHYANGVSGVIIREVHYYYDHENILKTDEAIDMINISLKGSTPRRDDLKSRTSAAKTDSLVKYVKACYMTTIPFDDLKSQKVIHDKTTGYTVCLEGYNVNVKNPESVEAQLEVGIRETVKNRPTGFVFEIVDNENLVQPKYFFSSNQVLRINPQKNMSRSSGLYVFQFQSYGVEETEVEPVIVTFHKNNMKPFLEACKKYGLWNSEEEAMSSGNPEVISKTNLETIRSEFARREHEHKTELMALEQQRKTEAHRFEQESQAAEVARKKEAHELEKKLADFKLHASQEAAKLTEALAALELEKKEQLLAMEVAAKKRDAEYSKLKDELDERKSKRADYYSSRESARKDTSEVVKFLPAIALGVLGAVAIFRK